MSQSFARAIALQAQYQLGVYVATVRSNTGDVSTRVERVNTCAVDQGVRIMYICSATETLPDQGGAATDTPSNEGSVTGPRHPEA